MQSNPRATTTKIGVLSVALALTLPIFTATPASATAVTASDWSQLKSAFLVAGGTVTLGANINSTPGESLEVVTGGTIIVNLNGFALTISKAANYLPGVSVPPTSTLTINDTSGGSLTSTGGSGGAGIGGGSGIDGGTVIINGGTVIATGGHGALIGTGAGIGGGGGKSGPGVDIRNGNGGTTTINGGTVTAAAEAFGASAGIGGGSSHSYSLALGPGNGGHGGVTTINGGTVTATGTGTGAGIGGGPDGNGGAITITGGIITATASVYAAGIGGGYYGSSGTLSVSGGTVTARGGMNAPGIGTGDCISTSLVQPTVGLIRLTGGTITATGGQYAPGIGTGRRGTVAGSVDIVGTPAIGAATNGGATGQADADQPGPPALITNSSTPSGIVYTAETSTVSTGGKIVVDFAFIISFASDGGTVIPDQTLSSGGTLTEPTAPTRDGFTFAGWTVGGLPFDFSTPITGPIVLTASWTPVPGGGGGSGTDLAATGFDPLPSLSLIALLLAAGFTLVAVRRRPRASAK